MKYDVHIENNNSGYIYTYCYFYLDESFSRNLIEVFTYNHMALMSLRSRSLVKAYMVLTRGDHL